MRAANAVEAATANLGRSLGEWRVSTGRIVMWVVFVLFFPGIFVAVGVGTNQAPLAIGAAVATALGLAVVWSLLSGLKIVLHEHGIERHSRRGVTTIRWPELESYRLVLVDQSAAAGAAGGALGALLVGLAMRYLGKKKALVPQSVILLAKNGKKLAFSPNLRGYEELLQRLIPDLDERLLAANLPAYQRGERLQFGKSLALQRGVGVSVKGMLSAEQTLPPAELGGASIERVLLVIRRSDGSTWKTVAAGDVPNIGVFQKLLVSERKPTSPDSMNLAWSV